MALFCFVRSKAQLGIINPVYCNRLLQEQARRLWSPGRITRGLGKTNMEVPKLGLQNQFCP